MKYELVLTGFPDKSNAEEMMEFLRTKVDHYQWIQLEVRKVER